MLGFLDVFTDIAMNTQGVTVQTMIGRSIMHRLHAFWSIGFTTGALAGWGASAVKLPMGTHLSLVAAALITTILVCRRKLTAPDPRPDGTAPGSDSTSRAKFVVSTTVVATAVMAVGFAFLEASPNDWSALTLRDVFSAGKWQGIGSVVFAGAMLAGRLGGDHVLERVGGRRLIDFALALASIGAAVVVFAPVTAVAVIGFGLWGLGVSVMFPQLYALAAALPGTSSGAGLGAMAIGQRSGFMLAPVIIGTVADRQNLRWSLALITVVATIFVLSSRRLVSPARSEA